MLGVKSGIFLKEMGIPYHLIGIGIGFLLGIWAFILAESEKGRAFIALSSAIASLSWQPTIKHKIRAEGRITQRFFIYPSLKGDAGPMLMVI
jgi:hypothetical protein